MATHANLSIVCATVVLPGKHTALFSRMLRVLLRILQPPDEQSVYKGPIG